MSGRLDSLLKASGEARARFSGVQANQRNGMMAGLRGIGPNPSQQAVERFDWWPDQSIRRDKSGGFAQRCRDWSLRKE